MKSKILIAIVCLLIGYGISDIKHNVDDKDFIVNYKYELNYAWYVTEVLYNVYHNDSVYYDNNIKTLPIYKELNDYIQDDWEDAPELSINYKN